MIPRGVDRSKYIDSFKRLDYVWSSGLAQLRRLAQVLSTPELV